MKVTIKFGESFGVPVTNTPQGEFSESQTLWDVLRALEEVDLLLFKKGFQSLHTRVLYVVVAQRVESAEDQDTQAEKRMLTERMGVPKPEVLFLLLCVCSA